MMQLRVIITALLMLPGLLWAQQEPEVPFIDQTLQRSDDFYSSGMKTLVGDVVKVTGAGARAVEELQKIAAEAVADKMAKSKVGLWKVWHAMQKDGEVDQMQFWNAYRKLPEASLTPDRSPIWEDGLRKWLNPQELVKWEAEVAKRRERIEKAIADYLNRGREQWKSLRVEARRAQVEELIEAGKLNAETAQRLRVGVEEVVGKSLPAWGKGLEKSIREYVKSAFLGGADDRIQALEGGQVGFGNVAEPEAVALEEAGWRGLLEQTLEKATYAEWDAREQQRAERRVKAMAMLAVSEVDRKLRLTERQRASMETLLAGVIRSAKPKIDAMLAQSYSNSEVLLMVLNGVPEFEVQKCLEPDQVKGWRVMASRYSSWWNQF